jgi:hypothetical protein
MMNDCALDAAATGVADAWTSGFGIYPALEAAAPAGDRAGGPAGSARAAVRAPRHGRRLARSRRPAADPGTPGPDHEQGVLPGINTP